MAVQSGQAPSDEELKLGGEGSGFLADLSTIPNLLSLSRIVGILIAGSLYLYGYYKSGLIIGAIAGSTDILDGWIARRLNQSTELGAILDRLSDLVLETVAFTFIVYHHLMTPLFFFAYLLREFVVVSARLHVAEQGSSIPTSIFGRLKTDFFSLSFLVLFVMHAGFFESAKLGDVLYKLSYGGIIGGLVCSYISGAQYLRPFIVNYRRSRPS
jgi:CDP-diacylglycerol--glycerol-3-phosphate 3-phosphatidyltransferase